MGLPPPQRRRASDGTETDGPIRRYRSRSSDGEEGLSSDSESGSISRMSDGSRVSFDGPQEEVLKGKLKLKFIQKNYKHRKKDTIDIITSRSPHRK